VSYPIQSIPKRGLFYSICIALVLETTSMGFKPELSAKAVGISSNASANALTAYCSTEEILSAALFTAIEHASSTEPPP